MLAGVMDVQNEDYRYFRLMDGPGSLEHRYITEDVPYLTCFFVSVAHAAGVKVPLFEGVVGCSPLRRDAISPPKAERSKIWAGAVSAGRN